MRNILRLAAIAAAIVAVSVLLAGVASTLALARGTGSLDTSLVSLITADYSIDPTNIRLAPLDPAIIEEARRDEEVLDTLEDNDGPGNNPGPGNSTPLVPPRGDSHAKALIRQLTDPNADGNCQTHSHTYIHAADPYIAHPHSHRDANSHQRRHHHTYPYPYPHAHPSADPA